MVPVNFPIFLNKGILDQLLEFWKIGNALFCFKIDDNGGGVGFVEVKYWHGLLLINGKPISNNLLIIILPPDQFHLSLAFFIITYRMILALWQNWRQKISVFCLIMSNVKILITLRTNTAPESFREDHFISVDEIYDNVNVDKLMNLLRLIYSSRDPV